MPFSSVANRKSESRVALYVSALLAIGTLLLYWPTSGYGFIIADDYQYITQNAPVLKGLSWSGINWALWSMYADNWHPLTWISHMLDCSVYGLYPGGHHLTNVFLHTANSVLLFVLLKRLTKKVWPSAFVAALFAWHPLHVESVAWVCERKDMLSTFFGLLSLLAYARYGEKSEVRNPKSERIWQILALVCFALALMSKPMLVTLPCVLLLLDYWPLNRLKNSSAQTPLLKQWIPLVVEKIPFFVLSFIGCVLTMTAQSANGAVKSADDIPLLVRVANPICSYGRYLVKAFWPEHLVIFYPMPPAPPWGLFTVSLAVIVALTWLAFRWREKFPWFGVGWLWFLGTLVPAIGIVQVGDQAMADRYTYIPYIGLFIIMAWAVDYWMEKQPAIRRLALPAGAAALLACVLVTQRQMEFWRSSIAVFSHATRLTAANKFSNGNLSYALAEEKRGGDAIPRYETILPAKMKPENGQPLIYDTASIGRRDDEVTQLSELLNYQLDNATIHNNLGIVLYEQGKPDEAIAQFEKATQLNPKSPWAYFNEARVLQERGRAREAAAHYAKAVELRPDLSKEVTKRTKRS